MLLQLAIRQKRLSQVQGARDISKTPETTETMMQLPVRVPKQPGKSPLK